MKANELRIGNLVQYGGVTAKVCHIEKAFFYCETELIYFTRDGERGAKPIPLTEEWLLRFGFELEHEFTNAYKMYTTKHQYDCSEITYSEKESLLRFSNGQEKGATLIPHIKYVHQLQNLYFALTGEELTLNP